MPKYLFHLGNTPDLSYLELTAVFPNASLERVHHRMAQIELESDEQAAQYLDFLGGTVKVSRLVKAFSQKKLTEIKQQVVEQIKLSQKTRFAVSTIGTDLKILGMSLNAVKAELSKIDVSASYLRTDQSGLSAAVFTHKQNIVEINLTKTEDEILLSQTIVMQDIDDWSKRDRSKPYFDRKKGMLPPKVARMMVNVALGKHTDGQIFDLENTKKLTLFDPFCGTGTVLMEAAFYGCSLFGSDLDPQAVDGAIKNLYWFEDAYNINVKSKVFRKDASQVTEFDLTKKIDLIVTEPYLGKPTPKETQVANIFKGLYKLYLGAFKSWSKILNNGSKIVIIFPMVRTKQKTYNLQNLIDKLGNFGYTLLVDPVIYSRKQAIVKRQIMVFEYNN